MDVSNFLTYTEDVFLALTQQNEKHIRSVTDSLEYIICHTSQVSRPAK